MTKSIFLIILPLLLMGGCDSEPRQYERMENVPMLGTFLNVIADVPRDSLASIYVGARLIDQEMKSQMSIFDSTSLISQINRGVDIPLTPDIIRNITLADSVSRLSGGLYDITVMPLVEAWGFARKSDKAETPNVDSLLQFVGYEKISINEGRLIKQDPRIRLDFNSIAKGYTVDKIGEILSAMGAKNYLVDIGGEIVCRGVNESAEAWRVGVERPIDGNMMGGELQQILHIAPSSPLRGVATSGNYRRFYIDDNGNKICHTIDPRTGHSNPSKLLSATVVASSCALADALATMFLAAGDESAMELLEKTEGIEAYFIFAPSEEDTKYIEYYTPGMKALLKE